jgi:hypothetical protein
MKKIFLFLAGLAVMPAVLFLGLGLAVSTLPMLGQKKFGDRLTLKLYGWLCVLGGFIGDGLDAYRI